MITRAIRIGQHMVSKRPSRFDHLARHRVAGVPMADFPRQTKKDVGKKEKNSEAENQKSDFSQGGRSFVGALYREVTRGENAREVPREGNLHGVQFIPKQLDSSSVSE